MNRKLLLPLILLITCGSAFGQTERFELGQRLRACEAAWDRQSDAVARRLAVDHLKKSVNLFFDGYGNGAIAKLCEERGWLLVAPRGTTGFTPGRAAEIIDSVTELYPVDRRRVFLVGHLMGAAQAVASAQSAPRKFAALAALGGGGQILPDSAIEDLPFFIGAGSEDFALANARRLESALKNRQTKRVVMREYPDVEHLVVVQVALPDVFRFLDEVSEAVKR